MRTTTRFTGTDVVVPDMGKLIKALREFMSNINSEPIRIEFTAFDDKQTRVAFKLVKVTGITCSPYSEHLTVIGWTTTPCRPPFAFGVRALSAASSSPTTSRLNDHAPQALPPHHPDVGFNIS